MTELRHIVPGNGGAMEVPCEDYEQYVVGELKALRAENARLREVLEWIGSDCCTEPRCNSPEHRKARAALAGREEA